MHGHLSRAAIADEYVEQRQGPLGFVAEMTKTDFLVVGGGVVGLSIARELKRRFRDTSVALVEKEPECGLHASGRNSGVIHAGFYYTADSLKAKFTRDGNRMLLQYCEEKKIPV